MTGANASVLLRALRDPGATPRWRATEWERLIREARAASLLARLAALLKQAGVLAEVPTAPRAHLEAARVLGQAHAEAVRREVALLEKAVAGSGIDLILLKGAAYVHGALPPARGRLFSDIDILVPEAALRQVESALMRHGWASTHHNRYDQRYYRRWMHELPPLRHVSRLTVVDVHHAILPRTARLQTDSAKLRAASRALEGKPHLRVLAPPDMVLHSAVHLFFNEDVGTGLRDLVDLDSLLRHFGAQPEFWSDLCRRAAELGLTRALYYALRYCSRILATPVPEPALQQTTVGRPRMGMAPLMDALYLGTLVPRQSGRLFPLLARQCLYLRAHWLRMPIWLLACHLTVKAFARGEEEASAAG